MMAKGLKVQELELSKDEAEKLALAIDVVQREYDFVIDPKVAAWGGLIGTATSIYAPRFMAYKMRVALETKKLEAEIKMGAMHGNITAT